MHIFVHDGSPHGLLTAVAHALDTDAEADVGPMEAAEPTLFGPPMCIAADFAVAGALLRRVREKISTTAARRLYYASLAGDPKTGHAMLAYLRLGLRLGPLVEAYEAHEDVRRFHQLVGRVAAEIHRMKGLTRFRRLADGAWYAPMSPDHRVLMPLAFHFRRRMPMERWLLHDVQRHEAVAWDGHSFQERRLSFPAAPGAPIHGAMALKGSADEADYQALWQTFFEHIAVPGRENPQCQMRHMPRRYWRQLVELCESPPAT